MKLRLMHTKSADKCVLQRLLITKNTTVLYQHSVCQEIYTHHIFFRSAEIKTSVQFLLILHKMERCLNFTKALSTYIAIHAKSAAKNLGKCGTKPSDVA